MIASELLLKKWLILTPPQGDWKTDEMAGIEAAMLDCEGTLGMEVPHYRAIR
jgi:hypothetical protein